MPREIPKHVRKFECARVSSAATTYHLRPDPHHGGWALATINDETYELNIQSDWGNWSYRWSASGMATGADGRRCTLTEFIANRDERHCDYLADKLTSHAERNRFDSYASVKAMRQMLVEMRIKQARLVIDYYRDEDPEDRVDVGTDDPGRYGPWERHTVRCKYTYKDEEWFLTKATTRELYDELGDLEGNDNADHFLSWYFQINGHTIISDEPWSGECMIYEPSPHYYQLLHGILPALVRACARRVSELDTGAPCLAPSAAVMT